MNKNIILSDADIRFKIRRIAYQIYEANIEETEIYVAGIASNGYKIAELLCEELGRISPLKTHLGELKMNKKDILAPGKCSFELEQLREKSLVLVDDVLNSGGVLMYGVRFFLQIPLKKFKTAVLVNRNHKKYPIKADFKGISLSTSLHNHIEVVFGKDGKIHAELN